MTKPSLYGRHTLYNWLIIVVWRSDRIWCGLYLDGDDGLRWAGRVTHKADSKLLTADQAERENALIS